MPEQKKEGSSDSSSKAVTIAVIAAIATVLAASLPVLITHLFDHPSVPPEKTTVGNRPSSPLPQAVERTSPISPPSHSSTKDVNPPPSNTQQIKTHRHLANEYKRSGNTKQAIAELEKVASLSGDANAYVCLAQAYVSTTLDLNRAIVEYKKAIKAPNSTPEMRNLLELANENKDNVQQALQKVTVSPNDPEAHRQLIRVAESIKPLGTDDWIDSENEKLFELTHDEHDTTAYKFFRRKDYPDKTPD